MLRPVPDLRERAAAVALIAAVELLAAAAATELAAAVGFAAGHALSAAALAVGGAAAASVAALGARDSGRAEAIAATLIAAFACVAGLLAAASTFDVSWDGQAYQQSGALAIARGWNPFGSPLPVARPYTTPYWVNHYAKGPWVRAAAVFLATGHIEAGKAWNFALDAASGLACAGALLRIRAVRAPVALAAAFVAALNPVVTPQMLTFYVDGQLAAIVTALVALVAAIVAGSGSVALVGAGAVFQLLPGVKFTGAVYGVAFAVLAGVAIVAVARHRARLSAVAVASGLTLGVLLTGWNPYVTNLIRNGHPLYPVSGANGFDVMLGQAPPEFLARSRLEKLAIATFSASRNRNDAMPTLKWPFTWRGDETTLFQNPDARYGGFGPLFSGALVLALVAFGASWRSSRRAALAGGAVAAALLATVLLNPQAWWARYVPQLWLVPLVVAVAAFAARGRVAKVAAGLTVAVLLVDGSLVVINAVHRIRRKSADVSAQLADLAREPTPIAVELGFESNDERLREAGVRFELVEALPCAAPEALAHSTTRFCRAVRR